MALACVPYAIAYPLYAVVSFLPFLATIRAIVGRPFGLLLAFAFPVVLINIWISQNGFLTASLLGGALLFMPVRPVLAGVCLGLLTYKPQYGVLFPFVLIATQQWRVFISATGSALLVAAVSWAAFGTEAWVGFFQSLLGAQQAFLSEGRVPWGKMQSIFATVRYFGADERLAWMCQIAMTTGGDRRCRRAVAQPRPLFPQGRCARRGRHPGEPVCVSLRRHGARGRRGVPRARRAATRLCALRMAAVRADLRLAVQLS